MIHKLSECGLKLQRTKMGPEWVAKSQLDSKWQTVPKGHEFEQTPGDSEGQGSLACCSPWGHKELDTTERLNHNPWARLYPQEKGIQNMQGSARVLILKR